MAIQTAIFGAGCFWGVEETFRKLEGVSSTSVGYSGGEISNPTYKEVCSGLTGHAEVVKIIFNNKIITYNRLLKTFWQSHNPTLLNKQGPDIGTQYRSVIIYMNNTQKREAKSSKKEIQYKFNDEVVTEILPFKHFYIAEEYHQQYFNKNGGGSCKI